LWYNEYQNHFDETLTQYVSESNSWWDERVTVALFCRYMYSDTMCVSATLCETV